MMSILNRFLGDPNERELKKIEPLVDEINKLESKFESFSDEQLKEKSEELKKKAHKNLDDILPEAFALVREAAKRTLNQRHFDSQLVGGIVLHQGKIAEMKTGEGKTLAATLAVYLNALAGQGVHVVTVNDYLSRRDVNWMGPVYHLLGLTCSCLNHEKAYLFEPQAKPDENEVTIEMENLKEVTRKDAYAADITYGTNNEFGFDYLRDNMAPNLEIMAQREPNFAIIDEVDSILIDEARTPLIISMPDAESTKLYEQFCQITPQLKENTDYNIDEKARAASLTEEGINKVEKILGLDNIYEQGGIRYVHHLEQALRAQVLFKRDKNYVVKDGQVIIVDEFTGRLMPGRRYSDGLHQALEAKEKVNVQQESRTLASITFQNYFRMYQKLSGMTGTAITSAEEFHEVYKLEVIIIPTNKPMVRNDLSDSVYKTEKGKFMAIAHEVKERHQKGQPVLIGTVSIEKNELLSAYLKKVGVPHQILNAKNHEQEAKIISQAGQKGTVTVATNMAGRGVDIVLADGVVQLGGLCVIGTERHEARRIDDQLRGRSGRQGDPGSSQFFVCLEDELMRIFGGDRIKSMMEMLKIPEDQPIENKMVSKAIESAQGKIEGYNFDIRKHILEYDDVMNRQRETIYKKRKDILVKDDLKKETLEMIREEIERFVQFHSQEKINYKEIAEIAKSIFPVSQDEPLEKILENLGASEKISEYLIKIAKENYQKKEEEVENKNMRQIEKYVLLRSIDTLWMDHLDNMDHLRDSVRLRAYGQKDPLVEYKNEGIKMFRKLLESIQATVVNTIYKVSLAPVLSSEVLTKAGQQKIGRNSPCPCGSGKKFKKC
ncbi:preprotein translocase subunit SecA, partial [Patescibacteria group bacterium]|nr:preprotein translocase subunit SecA [Patescibacteria group bacterium]